MKINVDLMGKNRSYTIYVEKNILESFVSKNDLSWNQTKVLVVTDQHVADIYLSKLINYLKPQVFQIDSMIIPEGESSKNLDLISNSYHKMLALGCDRETVLICLGGGVVGDFGGFLAATFLRGIRFIQIPTTLLAQVDSSVGGKVGVNLVEGKNLVGSFYQPQAVYIDPDCLQTLDPRQIKAGMAEVVKYGMIWDESFFHYLENVYQQKKITQDDWIRMISVSCRIKSEVVSKDEKEFDLRRILNLGHTFAHGLEKMGDYHSLLHGEAVSIGMVMACLLAERKISFPKDQTQRLIQLLSNIGLPTSIKVKDVDIFYRTMTYDKKKKNDKIVFVLPHQIGSVMFDNTVTQNDIFEILRILAGDG